MTNIKYLGIGIYVLACFIILQILMLTKTFKSVLVFVHFEIINVSIKVWISVNIHFGLIPTESLLHFRSTSSAVMSPAGNSFQTSWILL